MITIQQLPGSDTGPSIQITPIPTTSGGSSVIGDDFHSVMTSVITNAAVWNNFQITENSGSTVSNLTPALLDFTDYPLLKRIAGAGGEISIINNFQCNRMERLNFEYVSSGSGVAARGWTADSAPQFCWDLLEPLLTPGADQNLFSVVDHGAGTYTPNDACFAAAWDFSGVPVRTSRSGNFKRPGIPITRRHLWCPWHYRLQINDTVTFRTYGGEVETYTVIAITPGNDFSSSIPYHENTSVVDICIALLDRDLHEDIKIYQIAGSWITNILTEPSSDRVPAAGYGFNSWSAATVHPSAALLRLDQNRNVSICSTAMPQAFSAEVATTGAFVGVTIPRWTYFFRLFTELPTFLDSYSDFFSLPIIGDSGSPVFCPTSATDLCLVTVLTATTGGMMPNEDILNLHIGIVDDVANISTGYAVAVAPDPTL